MDTLLAKPGLPGGTVVNNPPVNAGDAGDHGLFHLCAFKGPSITLANSSGRHQTPRRVQEYSDVQD